MVKSSVLHQQAHFPPSSKLDLSSMSFATLVLIDEETANNLVAFVANTLGDAGDAFKASCDALIQEKKGVELASAILNNSDNVFALDDANGT